MEKAQIYGWKGYRLTAGDVSLVVAPDIGGRIISLSYRAEELFFVQKECQGQVFDFSKTDLLRAEKRKIGFRVWGGDKTWVAPQKDWWEGTPPLELDAGRYEVRLEGTGVMMLSPVCRETGIQIIRRVNLDHDGTIHLQQEIVNKSKEIVRKGIWNVTQLVRPFQIYLPTVKRNLRSYHEEDLSLPSHQIIVEEKNGWCRIPCQNNTLFKFGAMVDAGAVVCLKEMRGDTLAFLKTFEMDTDADYLHQSSVEVFNALDHNYLEVEIHAPNMALKPEGRAHHAQQWRLKLFKGSVSPDEVYEQLTGLKYQRA